MLKKNSKKSAWALLMALAVLTANSSAALAAPFSYEDSIREKALDKYLSDSAYVVAIYNTAPALVEAARGGADSVNAVNYKSVKEMQEIPYNTVKRLNTELEAGKTVTVREGVSGKKELTYKVKTINGNIVSKEIVKETVIKQPVDKIVEYGNKNASAQAPVNNGNFDYKYVVECLATAYDMSPAENGGYGGQTATGVPLSKGVIAVDPRVIPLGSRVYIEAVDGSWSYGYAVAADTGGAIKNKRVDLCFPTRSECIQFGKRKCRVYVLS